MSFVLGKIAWIVFKPSNLLFLGLLFALLLRLFRTRAWSRWIGGFSILSLLACVTLPLGAWLIGSLEGRFPPPANLTRVDGIVVLGGAIQPALSADRGVLALNGNVERMTVFAELARKYPDAKLAFTGGSGDIDHPDAREGDWVGPFLDAVAIPRARVVIERDSRNTVENARFTKALVKPQAGEVWLLVTSARHMPRSVGVFRKEGWAVVPYPADYVTPRKIGWSLRFDVAGGLGAVDAAAYEWIGLVYYWLTGRTDVLFPGQ
jgi:uncharacterized SAM-binding protein YcdF (DUF218 family)